MITNDNQPPDPAPPNPRNRPTPPPRFAGIDYGRRRIGLALADRGGRIASPTGTLDGVGAPLADANRVHEWATRNEVGAFVVGLPLNMDGTDSDQTRVTRAFAAALAERGATVELWDERLTSFQADELLSQFDQARGRRPARTNKGDPRRDALAAQIILQAFLDARRPG